VNALHKNKLLLREGVAVSIKDGWVSRFNSKEREANNSAKEVTEAATDILP